VSNLMEHLEDGAIEFSPELIFMIAREFEPSLLRYLLQPAVSGNLQFRIVPYRSRYWHLGFESSFAPQVS
jgi:hypothetical protein